MSVTIDPTDTRSLDRNTIIKQSYRIAGVSNPHELPSSELIETASILLDTIIEQRRGRLLFLRDKDYIPMSIKPSDVVQGIDDAPVPQPTGVFYEALRTHASNEDKKPGFGPVWKLYWREVPDPVTPVPPLWEDQVQPIVDFKVYEAIGNPIISSEIQDVELVKFKRDGSVSGVFDFIDKLTDAEFLDLYDPLASATIPIQFYFQKKKLFHSIFLQPIPDNADYLFYLRAWRRPEELVDADTITNLDKSFEGGLIFSLAVILAVSYNQDNEKINQLRRMESQMWADGQGSNQQTGDVQMVFNTFSNERYGGYNR